MRIVSKSLLSELETQLNQIHNNKEDILTTELAIKACIIALGKLKTLFQKHTLQNKAEEIEFLKNKTRSSKQTNLLQRNI